jgi:hypothetical protein
MEGPCSTWIAVAVVALVDADDAAVVPRMVVGNGSTESAAIDDLERRLAGA